MTLIWSILTGHAEMRLWWYKIIIINMVVISQFFIDTVHNPFTCKSPIPSFMTVIFWCHPDSNSASSNSWFHNYFILQEQCKILTHIRISRWLYFYYAFPWASRNIPDLDIFYVFRSKLDHQHSQLHSTLITRDKQCTEHKVL